MLQGIRGDAITRILTLMMAAMLAMGALGGLSACGANDEQVIRDGITAELDAFKNPTKETLAPYIGSLDSSQAQALEAYGVDVYEFLGHALRCFDYTIGDITVNGDTATVDLTVQNIDIPKVTQDTIASIKADKDMSAKVQELAETGDQAAVMAYVMDKLYEAMDVASETVSSETQLTLSKTDNTWNFDESSMNELISGIYGGVELR